MTLTRRLTWMMVAWIGVILAVFNAIFLARVQAQATLSLHATLRLELADAWHLTAQVPHLALVESGWETSLLVVPSAISFVNAEGVVTSSGWTEGFPADAFPPALTKWLPQLRRQMAAYGKRNPVPTDRTSPSAIPLPGTSSGANQDTLRDAPLPEIAVTARQPSRFVAVAAPFLYPDGVPGAIVVSATTHPIRKALFNAIGELLWTDVPVIILVAIGSHLVTVRGLKSIRDLIESIRSLKWSLRTRVHVGRAPVEIETLASTINQLLDRADKGLSEQRRFIADASHELRTPLAIIAGHANLLRRWGNTQPDVWEPAVRHIVAEVNRLQLLVDNMLLLARIDAGDTMPVNPVTGEAVHSMLQLLRDDGKLLRADLAWRIEADLPPDIVIHISANALRQVLVSLMDNAIKHSPKKAEIVLAARVTETDVEIIVIDQGEGIPPEDLPHVFGRFYRSRSAAARQAGGAGLGLSIAKELVEAHGGRLTIDSRVGEGTQVAVHLVILPGSAGPSEEKQNDGQEMRDF